MNLLSKIIAHFKTRQGISLLAKRNPLNEWGDDEVEVFKRKLS